MLKMAISSDESATFWLFLGYIDLTSVILPICDKRDVMVSDLGSLDIDVFRNDILPND
jgi:hypothetical protein